MMRKEDVIATAEKIMIAVLRNSRDVVHKTEARLKLEAYAAINTSVEFHQRIDDIFDCGPEKENEKDTTDYDEYDHDISKYYGSS